MKRDKLRIGESRRLASDSYAWEYAALESRLPTTLDHHGDGRLARSRLVGRIIAAQDGRLRECPLGESAP